MRLGTLVVVLLLAALAAVSPARAQEVTEDPDGVTEQAFDTAETRRYGTEASEMQRRYQELERLIEEKEDNFEFDAERDRYREELQEIDDTYEAVVVNFVNARLNAVQDHGSVDQPVEEWEKETSALRSLEAYARGELGEYEDATEAVTEELEAHEMKVEELRGAEAAPEEAAPEEKPVAQDEGGGVAPEPTQEDSGGLNVAPFLMLLALVGFGGVYLARRFVGSKSARGWTNPVAPPPRAGYSAPGTGSPSETAHGTAGAVGERYEEPDESQATDRVPRQHDNHGTSGVGNGDRYCPQCGQRVGAEARFCGGCGKPLGGGTT